MIEREKGYRPEHEKSFSERLSERLEDFTKREEEKLYRKFASEHGVDFDEAMKGAPPGTDPVDAIFNKKLRDMENRLLDETFGKRDKD